MAKVSRIVQLLWVELGDWSPRPATGRKEKLDSMCDDELLFSKHELSDVFRAQRQRLAQEIDAIPGNGLLNASVEDLCDQFEQRFRIEPVAIREQDITVGQRETEVDVRYEPDRFILDKSQPALVPGSAVGFHVPYDGDPDLFDCCPNARTNSPPRASVSEHHVTFTFTRPEHNPEALKREFHHELSELKRWVTSIAGDLAPFNSAIRGEAKARIEARKAKLLRDQGLVASLGFPLQRHDDVPKTYSVPVERRKLRVAPPTAKNKPYVPEPALAGEDFEHILETIRSMALVMERSPGAFREMKEEDLRMQILVPLNSHYKGCATGETFNMSGKTDILIRAENKNVFVAECKFWRGPKGFLGAIDQLLGYACWRDTKAAIIVFNRDRDLSTVLEKIPEVVREHPCYKRDLEAKEETEFRFVLGHRDDQQRELTLAVLVFEVPRTMAAAASSSGRKLR